MRLCPRGRGDPHASQFAGTEPRAAELGSVPRGAGRVGGPHPAAGRRAGTDRCVPNAFKERHRRDQGRHAPRAQVAFHAVRQLLGFKGWDDKPGLTNTHASANCAGVQSSAGRHRSSGRLLKRARLVFLLYQKGRNWGVQPHRCVSFFIESKHFCTKTGGVSKARTSKIAPT